jgi:hypothetical protein
MAGQPERPVDLGLSGALIHCPTGNCRLSDSCQFAGGRINERRENVQLKVLIKWMERALRKQDPREIDYRAAQIRRFLASQDVTR